MSWIKVRKDNKEYTVSTEAYKELFEKQGYEIVENKKPIPTQSAVIKKVEKVEEVETNGEKPKRNSTKQG